MGISYAVSENFLSKLIFGLCRKYLVLMVKEYLFAVYISVYFPTS